MPRQRTPFWAYGEDHDDFEDDFADEDLMERDEEFECCFPERCCMPGYHFPSECHTPEIMEALYADAYAELGADAGDDEGDGPPEDVTPDGEGEPSTVVAGAARDSETACGAVLNLYAYSEARGAFLRASEEASRGKVPSKIGVRHRATMILLTDCLIIRHRVT